MAKLVDAHASGACWLSQWKFESSSGHQIKKRPQRVFFLFGEKNLLICEAATACKTNVTSTLTETKLLSLFQAKPTKLDHKKRPRRVFF